MANARFTAPRKLIPRIVDIIFIHSASVCDKDEPCHFSYRSQVRRQAPELFIRVSPIGGQSQVQVNITYGAATCRPFPRSKAPFCADVFAASQMFNVLANAESLDNAAKVVD